MHDWYAPIARHVVYPLWLLKHRSPRARFERELRRTQYLESEEIRAWQDRRLRHLIQHAYRCCPFYRARFKAAGISLADFAGTGDLPRVPVLTRSDVQQNYTAMISRQHDAANLIVDKSGGSTGAPVIFRYSKQRKELREACTARHDEWAGYTIGDRKAILWGAVRDIPRYDARKSRIFNAIMTRTIILDASAIDDERMAEFARILQRYRPRTILAYANAARIFAEFLVQHGLQIPAPKGVITSAEYLFPESREIIERAFGARVYNRYGSREFAVLASECGIGPGMHIAADCFVLEFVSDGLPVSPGEPGKILVTDLRNLAMPMIRYDIGDMGIPLEGRCACGRGLPRMDIAAGRVTEFLINTRGERVSGIVLATYAITDLPGIAQVQLIQEALGRIEVKIVPGTEYTSEVQERLLERLHNYLGEEMEIVLRPVDEIPLSPSGKYRFSINKLG